jgi:hypothetical protein
MAYQSDVKRCVGGNWSLSATQPLNLRGEYGIGRSGWLCAVLRVQFGN